MFLIASNIKNDICYYFLQKYEVVPVHPLEAYRGGRGIAPPIRNLGAGWRSTAYASAVLSLGKKPGTLLMNGWTVRIAGLGVVNRRKMLLAGMEPRTVQPVALSLYLKSRNLRYLSYK
jgi:hypothetical protein